MRFEQLEIHNFRAIEHVKVEASSASMVVIAGPNGCGKSCVFDAIRFLKSAYGGYDANEWDNWLNEFQISRDPAEMRKILRTKQQPARISVVLRLHEKEKLYLRSNGTEIIEKIALEQLYPGTDHRLWQQRIRVHGDQNNTALRQVLELARSLSPLLAGELERETIPGEVIIDPHGQVEIRRSLALESVWRVL